VQQLFGTADLFVMPTLTRTALPLDMDLFDPFEMDGKQYDGIRTHWYPWTMLFNMTGHPAITLPSGMGSDGLPIGIQLVTRYGSDDALLEYASIVEHAMDAAPLPAL
jgi:aspartyl-tRNA(Asn)/glutamyl-tRNA(Gln) amidotransferase subunit A